MDAAALNISTWLSSHFQLAGASAALLKAVFYRESTNVGEGCVDSLRVIWGCLF